MRLLDHSLTFVMDTIVNDSQHEVKTFHFADNYLAVTQKLANPKLHLRYTPVWIVAKNLANYLKLWCPGAGRVNSGLSMT